MRKLAALLAIGLLSCASPKVEPLHIQERGETERIPLTHSRLDARLIEAAQEYEQHAPVPRIALFDLSLPADQQEYEALQGFAVIVITALAQDARELPPRRVYVFVGGEEFDLRQLDSRHGEIIDNPLVSRVFGPKRFDGLYLYPMAFRALGTQVILDFARNRSGFVVATFPIEPEPDGFPVASPSAATPNETVLERFIAREVPFFSIGKSVR